jgi:hypothetical protein
MWVTIYFEDREPIKWSIEASYDDCTLYEDTSIFGTLSGAITSGHIFKTTSGNIYEVSSAVYSYVYEYHPEVLVLNRQGIYILFIDGVDEPVTCRKLTESFPTKQQNSTTKYKQQSSQLIEAYITNDFEGLEYGNIYVLSNGQVWEQIEPYIWIYIWIMPPVIIWESQGIHYMKVDIEDIPKAVQVKRIK